MDKQNGKDVLHDLGNIWWGVVGVFFLLYAIIVYIIWKKFCRKCDPADPEQADFERKMRQAKGQFQTLLSDKNITVGNRLLGKGKFGMVYEAMVKLEQSSGLYCVKKAAVKISNPVRSDAISMLEEALKLQKVKHVNVIELYGIYYSLVRPMVVMEYLDGGNLEEYFVNQRANYSSDHAPSFHEMHSILTQVAKACNWMHSLNPQYLHRDIAPRNIMLSTPVLSEAQAKLTDFGLVQDLHQAVYITLSKELLPFDRLPPEVFQQNLYGKSADVWMFGVLMWESFSLGAKPHRGKSMEEVARLVISSNDSKRFLPPVPSTPRPLELLMQRCWKLRPETRPSFSVIVTELNRIRQNPENVIVLSRRIIPIQRTRSVSVVSRPTVVHAYGGPSAQPDLITSHEMTPVCTLPSNQAVIPRIIPSPFDWVDDRPSPVSGVDLNSTVSLSPRSSHSATSGVWSTMNGYGIPRSGAQSEGPTSLYVTSSEFPSFDSGRESCEDETWIIDEQPPPLLAPRKPSLEVINHGYANVAFDTN